MQALRLSEVAAMVGGTVLGQDDPLITGLAGIEDAGPGDLTFMVKRSMGELLSRSQATAVLIQSGVEVNLPAVVVAEPYGAFATMLERMAPDPERLFPPGIHPTVVVPEDADIAPGVRIGPYSVLGAGVRIGSGTRLGAHVILGCDTRIGNDCLLHSRVTVRENVVIGQRVILHSGSVVGSDGFGYLPSAQGIRKIPQVGTVEIQDDVELGANVCIDRATTGTTVIGMGSKIDNQVQIGHNVALGRHCTLSAQTGIAGSTILGDRVTAGGQVGFGDHLKIGSDVRIGGQSGIIGDVPDGVTLFGTPALERKESFRLIAIMRKLPELFKRVAHLEDISAESGQRPDPDQE